MSSNIILEPGSSERYKLACAPIEDSDQAARPHRLIRVLNGCSMGSQGSNVSAGGKLRLVTDCVDGQTDLNNRCTHISTCTLCWISANKTSGLPTNRLEDNRISIELYSIYIRRCFCSMIKN